MVAVLLILTLTVEPPDVIDVASEVAAFVPAGHVALVFETADLNGDGRPDHILVTEDRATKDKEGYSDYPRALLVLVGGNDGALRLAARNDKIVYCRECGGVRGDPFQGVTAKAKELIVEHYGGSGSRWSNRFVFRYSRRDDAWQLVRVEERSFHASDPEDVEVGVYRPPRDFGKIDLRDFDPHDFLGKGPK